MSWVAKNCLNDDILSDEFDSIYDCQNFIDSKLQVLEFLSHSYIRQRDQLSDSFVIRFGNCIRCWNTEQKRWCDGFDF